jgi:hypothetical protein
MRAHTAIHPFSEEAIMPDHDNAPPNISRSPCNRLIIKLNDLAHDFPYVEVEMRNGMEFKGFIVPTNLEPFLPDPRSAVRATPDGPHGISPSSRDFQDLVALWNTPDTTEPGQSMAEPVCTSEGEPGGGVFVYTGGLTATQLMGVLSTLASDTSILVSTPEA